MTHRLCVECFSTVYLSSLIFLFNLSLKKLAEYLKIDISRTIAIGDYDTDVAMLRAAGCGIAVANASQSALEAADRVTVSNEEDAIARVIQDLDSNLK